uniref:hypothetical protein n=1 Tax=Halomonas sp. TaxID=1486246 RepID=UPI002637EDBF|nr:hypothetical protein [Halomonas sp.]
MKRSSPSYRKHAEWTLAELELLERHFHSMTVTALHQRYFPERTLAAVRRMAGKLGLKKYSVQREYDQPAWTEEEWQLVAKHYPALKAPEIQRRFLPHRSVIAIRAAAKKLGLRAFDTHPWTEMDEVLLRRFYPLGGTELVHQYLPNRTFEAIKARALAKGIEYVRRGDGHKGDKWTEEELEKLRQHSHLPAKELAELFPHRPRKSVINTRSKMRLSPAQKWSQDELKTLREHLKAPLDDVCALFPHRPRQSVYLKRKKVRRELEGKSVNPHDTLHLNTINKWTQGEIDILHQHLDLPLGELCLLFPQRPYDGIRKKRAQLRRQRADR